MFGSTTDVSTISLSQSAYQDGTLGVAIEGVFDFDFAERSVSGAGDVNGDGYDDFIVGSSIYAAVFLGGPGIRSGGVLDLNNPELSANGGYLISRGTQADLTLGLNSVSSAGDINGDGLDDLIIATPKADDTGKVFVVYGTAGAFDVALTNVGTTAQGFVVSGFDDDTFEALTVSNAGDINGDGLSDIIVGEAQADGLGVDAGKAYVIFGKFGGSRSNIDVTNLDPSDGFALSGPNANDLLGYSVSAAGDINGDGFDDVIVGVPGDPYGTAPGGGGAYVIFGQDFNGAIDLLGDDANNNLQGTAGDELINGLFGNDTLVGSDGNDRLDGGADTDRMIGGEGEDTFVFAFDVSATSNTDFVIDFKPGEDVIELSGFAGVDFASLDTNGDNVLDANDDNVFAVDGLFINMGDANFLQVIGVSQLTEDDIGFT